MNKRITEYKDIEVFKNAVLLPGTLKYGAKGWLIWETEDEFQEKLKMPVMVCANTEEQARKLCYRTLEITAEQGLFLWKVKDMLLTPDGGDVLGIKPEDENWELFYKRVARKALGVKRLPGVSYPSGGGVMGLEEIMEKGAKFNSGSFMKIDQDGRRHRISDERAIEIIRKHTFEKDGEGPDRSDSGS
jgi:hypothetical protein